MRLPTHSTSGETLHGTYGLYHLTRLKADPQCSDLSTAFQTAQDQLKTRLDQHEAARANAMTALAVRDAQDAALDRQVRALSLAVLARVNNNRHTPLYQTYFPAGMGSVISAPMEVEMTRVGSILAKLNEETEPQVRAFLEPLQAAADLMRTAFEAHRAAMDAEVNAYGLLRAESIHWMDAYRRSYRDLQRKFYQDGDHAESFFRSPTPSRGTPQSEETTVSADAADVAGGSSTGTATPKVNAAPHRDTADLASAPTVTLDLPAARLFAPTTQVADGA
jgi:hypothetical protein